MSAPAPGPGAAKRPPSSSNDFIERQLDQCVKELEKAFAADVLTFSGPIMYGVDDLIRNAVESRATGCKKSVVILTTEGGYIEVVHRIVDTLRTRYEVVEFVIPNYAYSAGTVLAMSGDAIHMDYYSRLGPIDPQVETPEGKMVPALGYLEQYNRLIAKAQGGTITPAEVQLLINGFDQAELYQFEQAKELSITLLKEWLCKYKFKNWTVTQTRQATVTQLMKEQRAAEIAERLNDTAKWHSHGYGISKDVIDKDLNLLVDDFGKDTNLSEKIRYYHDLLSDYMARSKNLGVIHVDGSYAPFM
jgi:hypothetical protein